MSRRAPPWIIWSILVLHLTWAVLIALDASALHATTTAPATDTPRALTVAALSVACAGGGWSLWQIKHRGPSIGTLVALAPQQVIASISAYAATKAIVQAHYGDGVPRPWQFIAADQALAVIIAVLHAVSIVELHDTVVRGGHAQRR